MRKKLNETSNVESVAQQNNLLSSTPIFLQPTDPQISTENAIFLDVSAYDGSLKFYKLFPDVKTPVYATERSSCFDLEAYMSTNISYIDTYSRLLHHYKRVVTIIPESDNKRGIILEPWESALIPVGLIFDIPHGFEILLFPRSGNAVKKHLNLINCVGVIDEDYVEPVYVAVFNNSEVRQFICHGDRIAQAKLSPVVRSNMKELTVAPAKKTNRIGGFGSTNPV